MKIEIREIKGIDAGRLYASTNGMIFIEQNISKLAGNIQRLVEVPKTYHPNTGHYVHIQQENRTMINLNVARLMLIAFNGYRTDDYLPCYKDKNNRNLHINNLKWKLRNIELSADIEKLGIFKRYNDIIMSQTRWVSKQYNEKLYNAYVENISTLNSDSLKREFFIKYFDKNA